MNGNKRSIRRLHRLPTLARAARLRRFPSSKRACEGRVAGGGSSERRGITTKFSSAGNRVPAERNGNRLTFAPLCAKGRNLRGEGLAAAPFSEIRSDPPGGLPCPQLPVICCLLSGYTRGALRPRAPRTWSGASPVPPFSPLIVRPATAAPRALPMG